MAGKLRAVVKRERLHLIEKLAYQIEVSLFHYYDMTFTSGSLA